VGDRDKGDRLFGWARNGPPSSGHDSSFTRYQVFFRKSMFDERSAGKPSVRRVERAKCRRYFGHLPGSAIGKLANANCACPPPVLVIVFLRLSRSAGASWADQTRADQDSDSK
jgi:hypothetical protein